MWGRSSPAALHSALSRRSPSEAEDVRLLLRAVELVGGEGSCQVLEGAGGGGEGQAVVNGGIEGEGAVDSDALPGSPRLPFDGDVHLALVRRPESPDRRRAVVAQHDALTAREDGRHLTRVSPSHRPGLVHAAIQRHEPAALYPPRDRPPTHPGIEELRGRGDTVLPSRERQDRARHGPEHPTGTPGPTPSMPQF
jgi:hypothetical protein